jgi:hypothetical protein
MLAGTADPGEFAAGRLTDLDTDEVVLEGVEVLKVLYEARTAGRQRTLPPALHPCNPPIAVFHVWQCPTSPWGSFRMAECRIGARAGTRPRALVTGCVVSDPTVAEALEGRWGFPARVGGVELDRRYDRVEAAVQVDGRPCFSFRGDDPDLLGAADIQWTVGLTPALTDRGLRLVQVECTHEPRRAERLRPVHLHHDPTAWGHPELVPSHPVAASIMVGRVTLPRLRYLVRPDESAFTGTETL